MPWTEPQPLQRHSDQQKTQWDVEVWTRIKFFKFTWDPGVISGLSMSTFTVSSVPGPFTAVTKACIGLRVGMGLKVTAPSAVAGLVWDCAVQTDDTATIWIQNLFGIDANAPAGTWTLMGIIS